MVLEQRPRPCSMSRGRPVVSRGDKGQISPQGEEPSLPLDCSPVMLTLGF